MIVIVYNFDDAEKELSNISVPVIITNPPGSIKYLGARSIDYLFKALKSKFNNISKAVVNIEDDIPALFTLLKLNYKKSEIIYTGSSKSAKKLLKLYRESS
ncbi:hypothetical protein OCHUTO_0680 [Orientia chuto str. Dubai]|uniref:Uncharacterized protein n=1 Tax=Orientia chuto str. Dubai TaxID=1359168 RepID=A0A0F3MJC9_9RICK|nr:hypothetical protein [Candidatus Orientia mediorientalis]KJV55860.1 hypothetical protein OCHUTO_0680 [Orientia chuto str. Dubai]